MRITRLACLILFGFIQTGAFLLTAFSAAGQNLSTSEVGFGLGATNYKGEISPNYRFLNNRPAVTVFFKKDISKPIAVRASILAGMMRALDEDVNLPLNRYRRADMQTNIAEFAAGIDYKFLDFYNMRQHIRWTPYFTAGVAVANFTNKVTFRNNSTKPNENAFVFSIPLGIGVKYALSYHWNLGVEFGARATLFDVGDRIDYLLKSQQVTGTSTELPFTNPYDNDWYFYNGISISYTFYNLLCPRIYRNNPKLLGGKP
jgi:hypothetical protein